MKFTSNLNMQTPALFIQTNHNKPSGSGSPPAESEKKTMNINFEIVEKIDNNSELKKATENIITGVSASVQGYLVIGTNLDNINIKKLWAQTGFASFSEYSEKVLGISKATAYRIISVSKKFLMPEITKAIPDRIFSPFQDTALAALNPIGDYDTTAEFITENGITPDTPVSEIRKIVSAFQKEDKSEKEVDAETDDSSDGDGNRNETDKRKQFEAAVEKLVNSCWDIFDDAKKPKSKKRKTPITSFHNSIAEIKMLLNLD